MSKIVTLVLLFIFSLTLIERTDMGMVDIVLLIGVTLSSVIYAVLNWDGTVK